MKKTLFLVCLLPVIVFGQITPTKYTTFLPSFILAGQSNAANFWISGSYNSGSTIRHADQLKDSLEAIWGVPEVVMITNVPAGTFLAPQPSLQDLSERSDWEFYEQMMFYIANDTVRSTNERYAQDHKAYSRIPDYRFLIWIQGENDASDNGTAAAYYDNLRRFFTSVRADLMKPNLPVIMLKLNPTIPRGALAATRAAQQQWADADPNTYIFNVDEFNINVPTGFTAIGNVHYNVSGLDTILNRIIAIIRNQGIE